MMWLKLCFLLITTVLSFITPGAAASVTKAVLGEAMSPPIAAVLFIAFPDKALSS